MTDTEEASFLRAPSPAIVPRRKPRVLPYKLSKSSAVEKSIRNVYLRVKPRGGKKEGDCFTVLDENTLVPAEQEGHISKKVSHQFKFTKIFGPNCKQEEIFKETCFGPINNFLLGGNCLVFAYGATNAGKTYTIQGSKEKPGIIPRAINVLFNSIQGKVTQEIKFKPDKINNVLWLRKDDVEKELELKQSILTVNLDKSMPRRHPTPPSPSTPRRAHSRPPSPLRLPSPWNLRSPRRQPSHGRLPSPRRLPSPWNLPSPQRPSSSRRLPSPRRPWRPLRKSRSRHDLLLPLHEEKKLYHVSKVTKSSSTHSTVSDESRSSSSSGICPIFEAMKKNLNEEKIELDGDSNHVYSVWVSYAEIYNENIYDLLQVSGSRTRRPLLLGENEQKEVYIKGLTDICVSSGEEAFKVFLYGKHNLHQAATNVNHLSSRSHSIFSIKLVKHLNINCPTFAVLSMCTFVDLAGAERAKKTKNAGERMKESQCINTSLHVLGKCLEVLRHNQRSRDNTNRILPVRESKLTRLFQRALEGKELFTMIVNITQEEKLFDETLNVLKFSAIAMELMYNQTENIGLCSLRKSRFSQYMEKFSSNYECSLESVLEYPEDSRYMKLLVYIEELKQILELERKKNANLEVKVRREAYSNFKTIMTNMENQYKKRLKEEREIFTEYEKVNIDLYKKYFNECSKRKSESDSEDDEDEVFHDVEEDDKNEVCNLSEAYEERVKFLQNKVEALTAMLESADQVKASYASLQAKHSKLQFELSLVQQELEKALRVNKAIDLGSDGADEIVKELNEQLSDLRIQLKQRTNEFKEMKTLLEEAKMDYDAHFQEHEDFATRNSELENIIADKDEIIDDLQSQIAICNKKLVQHMNTVNSVEFAEKETQEKLQLVCEARDEYKFKVLQLETEIKKLQRENCKLKTDPKEVSPPNNDVRALEALVASHEDQLKKYQEKLMTQQAANKELLEEISLLKTSTHYRNQDLYEKEINILQQEIKDIVKEKKVLLDKLEDALKECEQHKEALKLAETALSLEHDNRKEMRKICDNERDNLVLEVQDLRIAVTNLQTERDKLIEESNKLKLANLELEETLKVKEEKVGDTRREEHNRICDKVLKSDPEKQKRNKGKGHQSSTAIQTVVSKKLVVKQSSELDKARERGPFVKANARRGRKPKDENTPQLSEEETDIPVPELTVKSEPDCSRILRPRRKKGLFSNDKDEQKEDLVRPKSSRRRAQGIE